MVLCTVYTQCTYCVHPYHPLFPMNVSTHTHTYWNLSHLQLARSPNLDRKYVNEMYILS